MIIQGYFRNSLIEGSTFCKKYLVTRGENKKKHASIASLYSSYIQRDGTFKINILSIH